MIAGMFDELKATFDWFEKCDERSVEIQNENFNLCVYLFTNIDRILSDEQRLFFKDKYEQIKITKSLTISAAQLGSEIDYYFKKGPDGQRDMFNRFQQLSQLGDIADMTNDNTLKHNITRILEAKIDAISATDPQMGRVLRNYFLETTIND
jgi:hypothetical protein